MATSQIRETVLVSSMQEEDRKGPEAQEKNYKTGEIQCIASCQPIGEIQHHLGKLQSAWAKLNQPRQTLTTLNYYSARTHVPLGHLTSNTSYRSYGNPSPNCCQKLISTSHKVSKVIISLTLQ